MQRKTSPGKMYWCVRIVMSAKWQIIMIIISPVSSENQLKSVIKTEKMIIWNGEKEMKKIQKLELNQTEKC